MKNILIISVLSFVSILTVYANEPVMTRTFPATSITSVESYAYGGITLNGDAVSEVVVEVYFSSPQSNWSNEKIKQTIENNYTFDIKIENGKLYVVVKTDKNYRSEEMGTISFKITVPRQVNSSLETLGGNIQISNMSGSHELKTIGGSLIVENVSGKIKGNTVGGNINVTNAKEIINLSTVGGNITAKDCSGDVNLNTVGGKITRN